MSHPDPFANLFPDLLENSVQEVGDLIGETLVLQDENSSQGSLKEIFQAPKKKFGLADFEVKDKDLDPVHLLFDLELAVELAGRLIMLPAEEITAAKKQGKLEGELLDAFSEIANIVSGVLNTTFQASFPGKKLHFRKGGLNVFPGKTADLPLTGGKQSLFTGIPVLEDKKLGSFQFFFPHSLLGDQTEEVIEKAEADKAGSAPTIQAGGATKTGPAKPDSTSQAESGRESPGEASVRNRPGKPEPDQEKVGQVLLESLVQAQEELGGLLGCSLEFLEQKTGYTTKHELLSKTKGKQILTRIQVSGDKTGQAYMLLPLKDAVYFGGLLLMMPAETITQTVKLGTFDGEVADAFGETANILIGSFSKQFKAGFPLKLNLKKGDLETMVPSQADPDSNHPLQDDDYYLLSARVAMEDKTYGPLEFLFPVDLWGLSPSDHAVAETRHKGEAGPSSGEGRRQKSGSGQKNDTAPAAEPRADPRPVISIIGEDPSQIELVEESIMQEDVQLTRLSLQSDLKQSLTPENPSCVFLLINRVNDQGLAQTIKVRAALKKECPLIVAGPKWTRTKVFKAVKYGATDILITPADRDSIRKKFQKYLPCTQEQHV
ncbi:MAG: hypothetical protein K9K64_11970 [Desulfohalobiaceae bacterium]|nr:hypothetical protein [Desulfohalobiaceae bacterium]